MEQARESSDEWSRDQPPVGGHRGCGQARDGVNLVRLKKNCSSLKGKTQRSAVGAPLTLTHSPHPLPLAEHIYLRASISAFSLPVIRPRRAPSLGV